MQMRSGLAAKLYPGLWTLALHSSECFTAWSDYSTSSHIYSTCVYLYTIPLFKFWFFQSFSALLLHVLGPRTSTCCHFLLQHVLDLVWLSSLYVPLLCKLLFILSFCNHRKVLTCREGKLKYGDTCNIILKIFNDKRFLCSPDTTKIKHIKYFQHMQ